MKFFIDLIVALIREFAPDAFKASKDTAQNGAVDKAVRDKARKKVLKHWRGVNLPALIACAVLLSGCFTRTIYVPHGTPVRLRETLKGVKVWVLDENGKPVPGEMNLPEGWYALPVATEEEKD